MLADECLLIDSQLESLDPCEPHQLTLLRYCVDLLTKIVELLQYFLEKLLFDSEQIAVCNRDVGLGSRTIFQEVSFTKYRAFDQVRVLSAN